LYIGSHLCDAGAAAVGLLLGLQQRGRGKRRQAIAPIVAPVEQVVAKLKEHHQREEVGKAGVFGRRLPRIVEVGATRRANRDCGQGRQGEPDDVFAIFGGPVEKPWLRGRSQLWPISLDATQLAEVGEIDGARVFLGSEQFPEVAVAPIAEPMLIEVIVDQCAEIEEAGERSASFSSQSLPLNSRREIERGNAERAEQRFRPLSLGLNKTRSHASGSLDEGG
jgi:hypothetical protein